MEHNQWRTPFKNLIFSLTLALLCTDSFAASEANLSPDIKSTAERFAAPSDRSMMTMSPGGDMVAFRNRVEGRDLVVIFSLTEGKVITGADVADINPRHLYFVNDDHLIMVVSEEKRLRGFRGELNLSTAYSLNTKTGELQQLLRPGDEIYTGQMGLGRIVGLSPDHKEAYMPAYVGKSRHDRVPDYSLMRVNLESPRRPKVHTKGHRHTRDYFLNEKGEVLAQERYNEDDNTHSIWVPEGRSWRNIYSDESSPIDISFTGLTPEKDALVMLKEDDDTGNVEYYTLALADGEVTSMELSRDDASITGVKVDINRVVLGTTLAGFTPKYEMFDEELDRRIKDLQEIFPGHSVYISAWNEDRSKLVLYVSGSSTSGDYYLATKGEKLAHLMPTRPEIPDETVNPIVQFEYKARDKLRIPALLTLPRGKAENPNNLPVVIMPHGGPASYDRQAFQWDAQALATHGYAVVQPQFRGSTGFGRSHWEAGHGEWGRGMQDDLTDAVEFLSSSGIADPKRVCILGGSYGGYAALAGAAFTPELYRCAISINGVSALPEMMDYERDEHGKDHWVIDYFSRSITRDYFTPERLAAYSPANFASEVKVPVLLIHGEDDEVVPIDQSELIYKNLKNANKPVELVRLPEENHHLHKTESRQLTLEKILSFLDEHMAVEPEVSQEAGAQSQ